MIKIKPLFFSFLNKKVKVCLLCIFICSLILISSLSNIEVSAVTSTVTSGLKVKTGVADTNQQNFIYIGGYDVFLVNDYIMFYDINGILVKVYNLTSANYGDNTINRIAVYNSTHLLVSECHCVHPTGNYITGWFMLLNINSLASIIYNFPVDVLVSDYSALNGTPLNLAVYVVNGLAFAVSIGTYAGTYGMGVWELFANMTVETVASAQNVAYSDTRLLLGGCWIIIPSSNSNSFYIIGEIDYNSHTYKIDEINYNTNSIVLIGNDGISGGYSGGYVYLLGSKFFTDSNGNFYNEVLISYPANTHDSIVFNIIKFNETFVDSDHLTQISLSENTSATPYVRLLGYDFVSTTGLGFDGIYNIYYIGNGYKFMQVPMLISNSTTNIISFNLVGGIISSYFQQWQTELFNFQTGNIGGFWDINTGILIELDYSSFTNSLSCATKFLSVEQGGNTGVGSGGTNGNNGGGSWFVDNGGGTPTPYNGGGNGGGTSAVTSILSKMFGNVQTDIIFVIYGVVCGLLTWKFALTGLIAGIGISTLLCTMAGLLSLWAVGLCVVLDITLIVLGSGLLNKTVNNKTN